MSNVIDVTDQSFEEEILKSNTPVLIDFWAEWCGPCKILGPVIDDVAKDIRKNQNILIVVGAEKVPRSIYEKSDYNVSVSNQPHSEISALAIVLDRLHKGKQFDIKFENSARRIIPTKKGKKVI